MPTRLLAVAGVAYLALHTYLLRDVGLANDAWHWLLYRATGWDALVAPYNDQPVVGEILLYRLWAGVVGVAHHWTLTLAYAALQVAVAALVFGLVRRRLGDWPALGAAVLVLFLGRAWETLLFPGTLTFVLPALAACVAWTVLDRRAGTPARLGAATLLALAGLTGGLGPAIALGLTAELVLARRARELWLAAAAVVPWALWQLTEAETRTFDVGANLRELPVWAPKLVAAAAGAVLGLPPEAGAVVLAAAVLAVLAWRRRGWWTPRAVGLLVTLLAAVLATGAARAVSTPATSSRYLYFVPIVVVLLAAEALRGVELVRRPVLAVAVALAVVLGVQELRDGKVFYLRASDATAARMGALELAGDAVPTTFQYVDPTRLRFGPATIAAFTARYGRAPLHTEAELRAALPESRAAADQLLAQVLATPVRAARRCRPVRDGALPRGDHVVRLARPAELRRFAAPGGGVALPAPLTVRLVDGRARAPWRLRAGGGARVCRP